MLTRRLVMTGTALLTAVPCLCAEAGATDFGYFLASLRGEARRAGVSDATLDAAFAGLHPNAHVLELDQNQPEFTLTWAQYRARVLPPARLARAHEAYAQYADLLRRIWAQYRVDPRIVVGIWGLESDFGSKTGGFGVIEALATLAYQGRRASFFRGELINALKILEAGDITPARMTGSYAGAMGQPQFMPSSYLRYAVDFEGNGRRDIWGSVPDTMASIANYLARSGWRAEDPWGQPVQVPPGLDAGQTGRDVVRSLGEWEQMGVRRIDGQPFSRRDVRGAVVMPDGDGGEAFMVYGNFAAIRRYNASDFYAIGVGLLGDACN